MIREEAIAMLKSKMDGSIDTSYEWVETVRMAIKALSANTKTVYCWECKYQHECVQFIAIEGKYRIIHSCSYGEREIDDEEEKDYREFNF